MLIAAFQTFYTAFRNVMPQVQKQLGAAYDRVAHQRWDKSGGRQG